MFGFLKARNTVAAAMVSATLVGVHAQEAEAQARTGAVVDGMSAVVGVATHALSVNPILPLVGLGFKAATLQYTDRLPETERTGAYAFSAATWQGSAAANVLRPGAGQAQSPAAQIILPAFDEHRGELERDDALE